MADNDGQTAAYEEFLKRSTVQKTAADWINKELRSCLNQSVAISRTDTVEVLSVGAGDGDLDLKILNVLGKCVPMWGAIHYTVLEPDTSALNRFKNNISSLDEELKSRVEFNWYQTSFENYALLQSENDAAKFHFIHFIHSLQYMDGEKILKQCYESLLKKDGVLLAMVQSEKSCSQKIYRKFSVHAENLLLNPNFKNQKFTSIEALKAFANESKWSYKSFGRGFSIDLTECFKKSSPSGDLMLDFLFRIQDLRRLASSALMEDIIQFLADECKSGGQGSFAMGGLGGIVIYKL